jgi:hypothetical protein
VNGPSTEELKAAVEFVERELKRVSGEEDDGHED